MQERRKVPGLPPDYEGWAISLGQGQGLLTPLDSRRLDSPRHHSVRAAMGQAHQPPRPGFSGSR